MQFMPATWAEVTQQMGIKASPFNPRASILAGGFYMRQLNGKLTVPRSEMERLRWAWSSYNAGFGTTLRAQRRSGGSPVWADIAPYMPAETQTYVIRIERWRREMGR